MSIRKIELLGSQVLRTPAEEVESFDGDLDTLVQDMLETMYGAQGIGLAAPQVGISLRVLVVDTQEADEESIGPVALVNPRVVEASKAKEKGPEGCLSIPGMEEVVERPESVRVEGFNPEGEPVQMEISGILSRAIQHEIDHLDGILFIDHLSPLKRRLLLKKWKKSREQELAS